MRAGDVNGLEVAIASFEDGEVSQAYEALLVLLAAAIDDQEALDQIGVAAEQVAGYLTAPERAVFRNIAVWASSRSRFRAARVFAGSRLT